MGEKTEDNEKTPEVKENNPVKTSTETKKSVDVTKKIRDNPWIVSTIVLAVLALLLIFSGNMGMTGKTISEQDAGENLVSYLNTQVPQGEVTLESIEEEKGLYKATVSYQGQEIPMYVTKDGENMVQGVQALEQTSNNSDQNNQQNQQDIPKSDNPEVELFVMSYCPYGTQAQKGMLPAVQALDDSIDFNMRYVSYLMHGEKEAHENTRQYCIDEEQGDKYMDYMTCFLDSGNSDECLNEANIDENKLQSCVEETNKKYNVTELLKDKSSYRSGRYPQYNLHKDLNEEYGVGGSPTLVINGKQVNSGRSPTAYLDTICQAFTEDSKPDVCEENDLSTETYSTMFGYDRENGGARTGDDNDKEEIKCTKGCKFDDSCISFGHRLEIDNKSMYCDISKDLKLQKEENQSCQNDFECLSNECSGGECFNIKEKVEKIDSKVNKSNNLLKSIWNFLSGIFK